MKKGVVAALLITLVVIITSVYPVTQNSTINIAATFDNTLFQIFHIDNWKNWYPEIKKSYKDDPASYYISTDSSKKIDTIIIPGKKIIIHSVTLFFPEQLPVK